MEGYNEHNILKLAIYIINACRVKDLEVAMLLHPTRVRTYRYMCGEDIKRMHRIRT